MQQPTSPPARGPVGTSLTVGLLADCRQDFSCHIPGTWYVWQINTSRALRVLLYHEQFTVNFDFLMFSFSNSKVTFESFTDVG